MNAGVGGRRAWWLAVAGVVLLVVLGIRALGATVEGRWVRVSRGEIVLGVDVEGQLLSRDSVRLGPPQVENVWDFRLAFVVPEGSEVTPGTPLFRFDTTELNQRLDAQMTERDSAEKELEKRQIDVRGELEDRRLALAEARARLRRARLKLEVPEELASRADLESARIDERLAALEIEAVETALEHYREASRAELSALEQRRDRAANEVARLEEAIAAMTVTAPRAGTAILVGDWRGDTPKVGDRIWRSRKVVEIPDLAAMAGEGEVAEVDLARIGPGLEVRIRLDAFPDRQYRGTVERVHRTVQQRSWRDPTRIVRVQLELADIDPERMRPGMRFRGQIVSDQIEDVVRVPARAVTVTPEGPAVQVRGVTGTRMVQPKLGRQGSGWFEVLAGLEPGDRVRVPDGTDSEGAS